MSNIQQPCVDAAVIQSGCGPSDWECICVSPAWTDGQAASCENRLCDTEDQYRMEEGHVIIHL